MPDWQWQGIVDYVDIPSTIAGFGGGLAKFLFSCKKGRVHTGRYCRTLALEVLGGALFGCFLSEPVRQSHPQYQKFSAFLIGYLWADVMTLIRSRVGAAVRAMILGDPSAPGPNPANPRNEEEN